MLRTLREKLGRKMQVLNTVEISKSALKHNYNFYKTEHPESEICPVLKSNAYGHGLIEVAKSLDKMNAPYFVVDSFYEVFELRKAGIKTPCMVIGYTLPSNYKHMSFSNTTVVALDIETIEALGKLNKRIKIHLKVDTGMHRMGVPMNKLDVAMNMIQKYPKLELEGICTHLADCDNSTSNKFTTQQVGLFKQAVKAADALGFDIKWKHVSATNGAAKIHSKEFNLVRLGLGLYGDSYVEHEKLKPVLTLNSTLIEIKDLEKGGCVSYNCTFTADKDMKIGVIPVGYYEGMDRRLSNKGYVYYGNIACKILGRVCMNYTVIDLSGVENPRKWSKIEVIGDDYKKKNTARWMADKCDTISYVNLTKIAPTIRRVVK